MYRVASASEYLVITGFGIADIKIAKKGWVLPWQSCAVFDVLPVNYTFEVQAMSAEKLPFILPAVFTIGPKVDDDESLCKYAKLISPHDKLSNHVKELVKGIFEGETCVLAASMTMEEIFRGTKEFKGKVFEKVQLELYQFGLMIYNMNVKQLVDVPGNKYLAMQREGAREKEEIRVRTQVAEANAKLAKKMAHWTKEAGVAQVEAIKLVALWEAELQGEVERMNALTQTKKLKVEFLSNASVGYKTKVQEANWELYREQKVAEAVLYKKEKEAEAQKVIAEANFYSSKMRADAEFYAKKRKAEALVWEALGGNYKQRSAVASRARGSGVEGERSWRRQGRVEVAASRASSGGVEQRSVVGRGRAAVASSKGQRQRAAVASSKGQRQRTGEKRTVS